MPGVRGRFEDVLCLTTYLMSKTNVNFDCPWFCYMLILDWLIYSMLVHLLVFRALKTNVKTFFYKSSCNEKSGPDTYQASCV